MQGSGLARDGSPSEPIPVAHAEAIEGLVVAARIAVRHMLEVDRNAVVSIEAIADFGRDVEQCAAAECLAIERVGFKVTVMHGDAKAERFLQESGKDAIFSERIAKLLQSLVSQGYLSEYDPARQEYRVLSAIHYLYEFADRIQIHDTAEAGGPDAEA